MAEVERLDPALVLLDVHMPDMDGFETARRIAERRPDVVVVLVTMDVDPVLARRSRPQARRCSSASRNSAAPPCGGCGARTPAAVGQPTADAGADAGD